MSWSRPGFDSRIGPSSVALGGTSVTPSITAGAEPAALASACFSSRALIHESSTWLFRWAVRRFTPQTTALTMASTTISTEIAIPALACELSGLDACADAVFEARPAPLENC
jgi:hypothetical protein